MVPLVEGFFFFKFSYMLLMLFWQGVGTIQFTQLLNPLLIN